MVQGNFATAGVQLLYMHPRVSRERKKKGSVRGASSTHALLCVGRVGLGFATGCAALVPGWPGGGGRFILLVSDALSAPRAPPGGGPRVGFSAFGRTVGAACSIFGDVDGTHVKDCDISELWADAVGPDATLSAVDASLTLLCTEFDE